ncbi:FadR/GntR family transcriptional regulator [Bradyrhizobium diazoefficiens]|uniref:FadR/GntR family transcriptional regulator n=1 Tax=Bradyrhizobium diazoefficiens TaxID=1355477 RepID=UPI00272D2ED1|nr:FadR/GntR family transcriptional regulator [Bradyrhizobium diazoefficiens]WLA61981.1 FadR/GntR family transcriptional regulator [Bradyrhizobium diazoefficiens]
MSTKMLHDPPSKPERSFEIVARRIAAMIQASYRIGQRLPAERDLAKTFGVSRPTVREAILSLAMAGMLKVRSNSGVYVISRQEAPDVHALEGFGPFENLEARQLIEPQIAAIAAQRGTEATFAQLAEALAMMRWEHAQGREADTSDHRFHMALAEATGNGALVQISDSLWRAQTESGIWQEIHNHMQMEDYRPMWRRDHEAIFEAVQARNPRKASLAMTRHLTNIRDALMEASNARSMATTKAPANPPKKAR